MLGTLGTRPDVIAFSHDRPRMCRASIDGSAPRFKHLLRDYVEPALTWMNNKISAQQEEVEFNLTYKDSKCSKDGVALFWGDEFKPPRQNPLAFIGPVCEDAAIQAALSGKLFQFPVMSAERYY